MTLSHGRERRDISTMLYCAFTSSSRQWTHVKKGILCGPFFFTSVRFYALTIYMFMAFREISLLMEEVFFNYCECKQFPLQCFLFFPAFNTCFMNHESLQGCHDFIVQNCYLMELRFMKRLIKHLLRKFYKLSSYLLNFNSIKSRLWNYRLNLNDLNQYFVWTFKLDQLAESTDQFGYKFGILIAHRRDFSYYIVFFLWNKENEA